MSIKKNVLSDVASENLKGNIVFTVMGQPECVHFRAGPGLAWNLRSSNLENATFADYLTTTRKNTDILRYLLFLHAYHPIAKTRIRTKICCGRQSNSNARDGKVNKALTQDLDAERAKLPAKDHIVFPGIHVHAAVFSLPSLIQNLKQQPQQEKMMYGSLCCSQNDSKKCEESTLKRLKRAC